jgi:hypothetical protein
MEKDFLSLINNPPHLNMGTLDGKPFFPPWDPPYRFNIKEIKQCLRVIYDEIASDKMTTIQTQEFIKKANSLFREKIQVVGVLIVGDVKHAHLQFGTVIMDCDNFSLKIKREEKTYLLRIALTIFESRKYCYDEFGKRLTGIKKGSQIKIFGDFSKVSEFIGKDDLIGGSGFPRILHLGAQGDFCLPSESDLIVSRLR